MVAREQPEMRIVCMVQSVIGEQTDGPSLRAGTEGSCKKE